MYKVFEYVPESARRYASRFKYKPTAVDLQGRALNRLPRDRRHYCPLGRVLNHLSPGQENSLPNGYRFALLLTYVLTSKGIDVSWAHVCPAAEEFIRDWDDGKIPNLREAMGV